MALVLIRLLAVGSSIVKSIPELSEGVDRCHSSQAVPLPDDFRSDVGCNSQTESVMINSIFVRGGVKTNCGRPCSPSELVQLPRSPGLSLCSSQRSVTMYFLVHNYLVFSLLFQCLMRACFPLLCYF